MEISVCKFANTLGVSFLVRWMDLMAAMDGKSDSLWVGPERVAL